MKAKKFKTIPEALLMNRSGFSTPAKLNELADREQERRGTGTGPNQFPASDHAAHFASVAYEAFAQRAYLNCEGDEKTCLAEAKRKGESEATQALLSYTWPRSDQIVEEAYKETSSARKASEAPTKAIIDAAIAPSWWSSTPGKVTIAAGVVGLGALAVAALVRR